MVNIKLWMQVTVALALLQAAGSRGAVPPETDFTVDRPGYKLLDRDAKEHLYQVGRAYGAFLNELTMRPRHYDALKSYVADLGREGAYSYTLFEGGQLFSGLDKLKAVKERMEAYYAAYADAYLEVHKNLADVASRETLAVFDWQMHRAMYLWRRLLKVNEELYPELGRRY